MRINFGYLLPPEAMGYAVNHPDERCITKIKSVITPEKTGASSLGKIVKDSLHFFGLRHYVGVSSAIFLL